MTEDGQIRARGVKPVHIVAALEILGLFLIAAAVGVAGWVYVDPSVGLLAAGFVQLGGAWLMERNFTDSATK